ncbi:aminodeoxychorismate/anthranilate synthase component II [Frankia sp. R82]|nr:aminodeoxychorismate/anthranilate synthase component II [Frankia sp. R82]
MLAHQLRALGLLVTVRPWSQVARSGDDEAAETDLLIIGPGPGDPSAYRSGDPKMVALRRLVGRRLATGRPLFGVCLGHQLLADALGLHLRRRPDPHQGLARTIDLFGRPRLVGFYSSFTAMTTTNTMTTMTATTATRTAAAAAGPAGLASGTSGADLHRSVYGSVRLACDPADGSVHALRGPACIGMQFHPESALSRDGLDILRSELAALFAAATPLTVPIGAPTAMSSASTTTHPIVT